MKTVKPTICTSFSGCTPPQDYCIQCSHAIYAGRGRGKSGRWYRWEHGPMWGPMFWRKGKFDWIPHFRHEAWKAFGMWHDRKFVNVSKNNGGE